MNNLFIIVNIKEDKLKDIEVGDDVDVIVDGDIKIIIDGKVEEIGYVINLIFLLMLSFNLDGNYMKVL